MGRKLGKCNGLTKAVFPCREKAHSARGVDRRVEALTAHDERTVHAAERTCAAWVRTGLAALASDIGAIGNVLIVFGTFWFLAAVWREMPAVVIFLIIWRMVASK